MHCVVYQQNRNLRKKSSGIILRKNVEPTTLFKKRLLHRYFPVNFCDILLPPGVQKVKKTHSKEAIFNLQHMLNYVNNLLPLKQIADLACKTDHIWVLLQDEKRMLLGLAPDVARGYIIKFPLDPPGAHTPDVGSCWNEQRSCVQFN